MWFFSMRPLPNVGTVAKHSLKPKKSLVNSYCPTWLPAVGSRLTGHWFYPSYLSCKRHYSGKSMINFALDYLYVSGLFKLIIRNHKERLWPMISHNRCDVKDNEAGKRKSAPLKKLFGAHILPICVIFYILCTICANIWMWLGYLIFNLAERWFQGASSTRVSSSAGPFASNSRRALF